MGKTAYLFPGQGAQYVGMGSGLAETYPEARSLYEQADDLLGFSLSDICFEGPEDRLTATDVSQPAILVTSLAVLAALRTTEAGQALQPQAAAGLSLGEYTALVAAGALAFDDAVRITHLRGQAMQEACEVQASGMVSLIGVDPAQAEKICDAARDAGIIWPANYNCPGQVVVSGVEAACEKVVAIAEDHGAQRAVPLTVAGAFHSPLMAPAREKLTPHLNGLRVRDLAFPVVANVTGHYYEGPVQVPDLLARQVDGPVRWQQGMERLLADGFDRFYEIGPGRVLTGLLKRTDRKVGRAAVTVGTVEDIGALAGA
ncbi:MAG: ACP S-malonyltransferase [Phycisphaerae bacterium]